MLGSGSNNKQNNPTIVKRHPTTMMRNSLVWEYVDRSSIMLENARKGV